MSHLLDLDKLNSSQNFFLNRTSKEDRSVFAIKHTRKLIEADAQLLANRIALLKQEELRSWKKIEEAKKKASEIYMTKLKIEEKHKEKEARKKEEVSQIKDFKKLFNDIRYQHQEKMATIKSAIHRDRHSKFVETKQQKGINEVKKKKFEEQVLLSKRSRSQSIKEQEAASKAKLVQYHEEKQKSFKQNHKSEAFWQIKLKKKREAEVFTLEKMEMEMLRKLEEAQNLEKAAYEQVEEALNLSPSRYIDKYVGDTPSSTSKGGRRESFSRRATTPLKITRPKPIGNSGNNSMVMKKKDMNLSSRIDNPNRSMTVTKRDSRKVEDWIGKEARIEREQKVYGRKGSYNGVGTSGKVISSITTSKGNNLNHSYFEYNKRKTNPFDSGTETISRSDVVNIGPHITLDESTLRRSDEKTNRQPVNTTEETGVVKMISTNGNEALATGAGAGAEEVIKIGEGEGEPAAVEKKAEEAKEGEDVKKEEEKNES